ncbi:MAG: hypothetical protein HC800_14865 [Phormidesmis sp. RL_2_1]|nr:hypothetical protein [Phormidesmis sp. RL_2_1]
MLDEIFTYATPHTLADLLGQSVKLQGTARCRVRVSGNTVIATELPDNPGMSLTNAAASVAMQVCQYYEIPIQQLVWIEHYPEETGHEETFDLVRFGLTDGQLNVERWQRLSRHETEQLFVKPLK